MNKRNIHVVPAGDRWAVKREGNPTPVSKHPTQRDATEAARPHARAAGSEVVIHRPDGRIRDKDSYGNDPCPPKDRKH